MDNFNLFVATGTVMKPPTKRGFVSFPLRLGGGIEIEAMLHSEQSRAMVDKLTAKKHVLLSGFISVKGGKDRKSGAVKRSHVVMVERIQIAPPEVKTEGAADEKQA